MDLKPKVKKFFFFAYETMEGKRRNKSSRIKTELSCTSETHKLRLIVDEMKNDWAEKYIIKYQIIIGGCAI